MKWKFIYIPFLILFGNICHFIWKIFILLFEIYILYNNCYKCSLENLSILDPLVVNFLYKTFS